MTNKEKEIRAKIGAECLHKKWRGDYLTACSGKYDFMRCPDEFECLTQEIEEFEHMCDNLIEDINFSCDECWKHFLEGDLNEKN